MVSWSSSSCSMRPMAVSWSSSAVRSCITRCARCWSFQRLGSSACLLSSASRARAVSKSKMPPQQPDRLLDLVDDLLGFRAHGSPAGQVSIQLLPADVATDAQPTQRSLALGIRCRLDKREGRSLVVAAMGNAISPRGDMPKNRVPHNSRGRIMSSINTISIDKLARLIGTPHCPALVDVRTEEDFKRQSPAHSRLHAPLPCRPVGLGAANSPAAPRS